MSCASFLNIFSLHYFLWFGGQTSIFGIIDVYSKRYAHTDPRHFGVLNTVLTFVGIVTKMLFCSLADRHRAHRQFFIFFILTALVGYACLTFLPFFVEQVPSDKLNIHVWVVICICWSITSISMSVISSLSDTFAMNSSVKNNTSYGYIRLWGTLGWGAASLLLTFISSTDKLPTYVPGLIMTLLLIILDIGMIIFWPNKDDFKPTASGHLDDNLDTWVATTAVATRQEQQQLDIENQNQQANEPKQVGKIAYGTMQATQAPRTDANKHKDPSLSQNTARGSLEPSGDARIKSTSNIRIQWLLFKEVVRLRMSIFKYMILFVISGALISLQWSFLTRFLELTYPKDSAYVYGLSMLIQSMLGELPFFVFSDRLVKFMGWSNALGVSIMTIGIRYMLYCYLLTPTSSYYFLLLTEPFAGPNFGLFYVVMTKVGLDYSDCEAAIKKVTDDGHVSNDPKTADKLRQALRATMQSLMSACYEGLGVGIGSIVGGYAIVDEKYENLWFWSAVIAFVLGSFVIIADHFKLKSKAMSLDIN